MAPTIFRTRRGIAPRSPLYQGREEKPTMFAAAAFFACFTSFVLAVVSATLEQGAG